VYVRTPDGIRMGGGDVVLPSDVRKATTLSEWSLGVSGECIALWNHSEPFATLV